MKRNIIRIALMAIMVMGFSTSADAQLSNLLKSAAKSVGSVITSKLVPTSQQIVGTWTYQSPAVLFDTDNALTNLGGATVSTTIENKLQTQLAKYGIKSGQMTITFNSDKTFSVNYKSKKITGTYTITDSKVQLTFNGKKNPCSVTPQLNNGSLVIVANATKIKDFLQGIGAASSSTELNSISTLLKQCKGMQIGMRLKK